MHSIRDLENASQPPASAEELQVVAKLCSAGDCPTIYRAPDGGLIVQGYTVDLPAMNVPVGENLVRIPPELLVEAMRTMRL